MAIGGTQPESTGGSTLSEINVTPLVDVMLVLLTIFMVASSVETIQVAAEKDKLLKEKREEVERVSLVARLDKLKEQEEQNIILKNREERRMQFMESREDKLKEMEEQLEDKSQNVPIELPKATSEAVNLAEQKKIVVTLTRELVFYIGDTKVVDCSSGEFFKAAGATVPEGAGSGEIPEPVFRECLKAVEVKLVANVKLQEDKECYLRADRKLDYGRVLGLMAAIRKAGITKFGLVSEEDKEEKKGK